MALVLGCEPKADEAIAAFDAKVTAARAYASERLKGKTIAFFRTWGREWRLYGRRGMCGGEAIYGALGVEAPTLVADEGTSLDPEKLVHFDADYLVIVSDGTFGAEQTMTRLRGHPLWRRVTAVQQGHVLEITTYRHWVLSGLVGKARMIDEVFECIRLGETDEAS
jgi:ABC-type Fe3+-hydroxamate transport system substrate-binding protein